MKSGDTQQAAIESELVALVEKIVRESGSTTSFDAQAWVAHWLENPHPALGGCSPNAFLNTQDGKELVVSLILRIQSGSFS